MYERFAERARKVMHLANEEARRLKHEYIGTEHILWGLVKEDAGLASAVLKNLNIDGEKIRLEIGKIVQPGPEPVTRENLSLTPRSKQVIAYTTEEARDLNDDEIGPEHLLLGLIREQDGVAGQLLMYRGLTLDAARQELVKLRGRGQ